MLYSFFNPLLCIFTPLGVGGVHGDMSRNISGTLIELVSGAPATRAFTAIHTVNDQQMEDIYNKYKYSI